MPTTQIQINTGFNATGAAAADVALGKVGATASKAERDLLAYASTVAKAQRTQGDAAGAVRTYEAALQQVDRTSKQAIATEGQLAASIAQVQRQTQSAAILPRTVESFGTEAIDQVKSSLIGIVGPAALVTTALQAIPAAINLAEVGAQAEVVRTRFDSLAKTAGTTGDALLGALRKASGGQINDLNLQLTANRAQLLGVAHDADTFGQLMAIARDRAQNLGTTTQSAFDDIVTGIGRASPRILDNLGIIISEKEAYQAYAQSIGKSTEALDENEKKQAILKAVLDQGNATLKETGGAIEGAAAGQARLGASIDNLKAKLGSFIADGSAPMVNSLSDLLNGFDGTTGSIADASVGAQNLGRSIAGLAPLTNAQQQAQRGWTESVLEWIAAREAQIGLAQAPSSGGGGSFTFADPAAINDSTAAQRAYADSLELTGVQSRAAALAADQKSTSDKVAAIDAQTHAIAQNKLAQQAQNAAQALLIAGPAGARAAALLAQSSSQVDVLTAAYYRLAAAQPTKVQTPLEQGLSALRSGSVLTANDISDANTRALTKQADENKRIRDKAAKDADQLDQINFDNHLKQTKTNADKIALLRKREAQTTDPIERARIEGQIIDLQNQGGHTRVSAAASTGLQLQNVEENTQAELLRTQREGLERLRDQEEDYTLRRVRSKEDEDEKIRGLLARGERAAAARERADFEKKQKRDQEDFNIQRQRTIRNNNESTGDITGGAARRTDQIQDRAALRGVRPVAAGGASAPILSTPAASAGSSSSAPTVIQVNVGANVNLDSQQVGSLIFDVIRQRLDADLALELRSATPPGAGQSAVAGARP